MTKAENTSGYINTTEILKYTKRLSSEMMGDGQQITHFSIVESAAEEGGRELVFGDRKFKIPRTASIRSVEGPAAEEEKLDALSSFACIALEQVPNILVCTVLTAFVARRSCRQQYAKVKDPQHP